MALLGKLLGVMVGLVVLGLAFAVLERFWPSVRRKGGIFRRGMQTDLGWFFFQPTFGKLFTSVLVFGSIMSLAFVFTSPFSRDELRSGRDGIVSGLPLGVQFLLFLAMADVIGYWSHRAFHRLGVLWKFHAVHHSSTNLDWLSSARVHPINDVANNVLLAAPLLFLGFAPAAFAAYVPFLTLYAIMLHANVSWTFGPLRKVIASPTYHRWHHSAEAEALNKNFSGLLPCVDIVFGTFYMPKGVQPREFGVVDQAVPDGFFGQMAHPFRRPKENAAGGTVPAATA